MSGLFGNLRLGARNLSNIETAISVVNENVSNVNTPGYSRKRVSFTTGLPEIRTYGVLGGGAEVDRIESVRNDFLQQRLLSETQLKGSLDGQSSVLSQIEGLLFASKDSGISSQISKFFNGFLDLAADPSSLERRQAVLAQGAELGKSFASLDGQLKNLRAGNRIQIQASVNHVNQLLDQIAALNKKIQPLESQGLDAGSLLDERQHLMSQLSDEIGFVTYQDTQGNLFITTNGGQTLLIGGDVTPLNYDPTTDSVAITSQGLDITSQIQGGKLAGLLTNENVTIPKYLDALNQLAGELATQVNAIHQGGVGLDGSITGLDFFSFDPAHPADTLSVAITSPQDVGAAAPGGGPGDGTVAQQIADLRDSNVSGLAGKTFTGFYSDLVFQAGIESQSVAGNLATQQKIVESLQNQRDSVSGVSLDEEAVQLIQLQRAYQANTRFLQVVNELLDETMNIIR